MVRELHPSPTHARRDGQATAATHEIWRVRAMVALAALGVGISGYLTWVHYSGALALCAGAGGCEQVQASRYAMVAGLPVALLGLLLYLGILGLSIARALPPSSTSGLVSLALFGLALAGTLFSAYLTYLELFVIQAICPWCVTSAIVVTALFALSAWDLLGSEVS